LSDIQLRAKHNTCQKYS